MRCEQCGQKFETQRSLAFHQAMFCTRRSTKVLVAVPKPATVSEPMPAPAPEPIPTPVPELPKQPRHVVAEELKVPDIEPNFYISQTDIERLDRIARRSQAGEILNVILRGPKGSGKTTLARQFAALRSRPFYEIHCGSLVEPEQWFGKDRLTNGETWYRMARFITAIETGGTVVLLDEVNRPHPEVLNALFGLLDWRRSMWVDDLQREVRVAAGVVFFATINEGEGYIVNPLDDALRERFGRAIEVKYPPKRETAKILVARTGIARAIADKLADFREEVKRKPELNLSMSVRQLQIAAEEVKDGADLREAVMVALVNHLTDIEQKKAALAVLQHLGEDIAEVMHEVEG